jgi:hypothetical protein
MAALNAAGNNRQSDLTVNSDDSFVRLVITDEAGRTVIESGLFTL